MDKILVTASLSINLLLSACAVYKIDVQQGNVVTQEMIAQLQWSMPAQKVRFIMGTPLIIDVFHPKRWDYVYSFQPGGGKRVQRHIALFFDDNDRLIKIKGDVKVGARKTQQPTPPPYELDNQPIL